MFKAETKKDVRDMLVGRRVKRVEFGSPDREVRSMALHLDDGSSVVLSATSFQTIAVEG